MLLIFAGMGRHMKMLGMNFYCDGQNIDTKTSGIIHINIGVHNYFWSEAVFDTEQCSKKPLLYLWGQNPWKSLWWRLFFSKKHLKKDVFCVMSLRRLEHISKKMYFPSSLLDVSKAFLAGIRDFSKILNKNDFVWFP